MPRVKPQAFLRDFFWYLENTAQKGVSVAAIWNLHPLADLFPSTHTGINISQSRHAIIQSMIKTAAKTNSGGGGRREREKNPHNILCHSPSEMLSGKLIAQMPQMFIAWYLGVAWAISYKKNSSIACSQISSCIFLSGRKFGLGFLLVYIEKGQAIEEEITHKGTIFLFPHPAKDWKVKLFLSFWSLTSHRLKWWHYCLFAPQNGQSLRCPGGECWRTDKLFYEIPAAAYLCKNKKGSNFPNWKLSTILF